ncbi:glycosyltransferase [Dyadobacter sp. 676]|uniref:Glycosyltransferase n=1 Tax=Dyadobacter sp. 676 TaxID=3088362 RepID=A0AAU8FMA1_9BACT
MQYQFPDTTLLITHYNRSGSLERLLATFESLECRFADIVVSDDGSRPEHLEKVRALGGRYNFRLVTTPENRGLGNNINKGQDAVQSEYTLYVQEDFQPSDIFPAHFRDALTFMREDSKWDIVRFYAYFAYPTLKPFKKGYSEMVYRFWDMNHLKFYCYSDHPHLRRSTFPEKFGRYPEGIKGDLTEYKMAVRFLQKKARAYFSTISQNCFTRKTHPTNPVP